MRRLLKIAAAIGVVLAAAPLGAAAPKGPTIITMKSFKFTPQMVTVPVGTTITWVNRDGFQHMIQATNGEFQSPRLGGGKTFTVTLTRAGDYRYYCGVHSSMTGRIVVTDRP